MNKDSRIYIAGNGLLGNALYQHLKLNGYNNLITRTHVQLDLTNTDAVELFFKIECPEYVFLCAGKIGGVLANSKYPVEFLYDNTMIEFNIIKFSHKFNVKKLLFIGSNCAYPKECSQPIKEDYLLSGYLESTSEGFSIAKITGIKLCQAYNKQYNTNYIIAMPCNLYGIGEKFDKENSHLIPSLIMKIFEAKKNNDDHVIVWGDGTPKRELLYISDMVNACIFLMDNYNSNEIINVGLGFDMSIKEIAFIIADIIGYKGVIQFDTSKPNGTMRKLLDSSKINKLGWNPSISFKYGIKNMYDWWVQNDCKSTNK
jgi:GDP-L-fucose synthase